METKNKFRSMFINTHSGTSIRMYSTTQCCSKCLFQCLYCYYRHDFLDWVVWPEPFWFFMIMITSFLRSDCFHINETTGHCLFLGRVVHWDKNPTGILLVQSQQWKHQNNVWNLFKVNNRDTRTTSMTLFWCLHR